MSDDRRVNKRSDRQVRETASRTKDFYKTSKRRPVNIIGCLESGRILTDQGQKQLIYRVLDDRDMLDADGKTEFIDGAVIISAKRSVHESALFGIGRSRMTLAHELAHGVMHYGAPKFRVVGASGSTSFSQTNAYESAEHQAKVFASSFLIHDEQAVEFDNAEAISEEFGVSLQAAQITLERLLEEKDHSESAERVMRMNEEVQKRFSNPVAKPRYLDDPCVDCGERALLIIGVKLLCDTCGRLTDRLQDGDR
jgi:hypothetical protein